MTRNRKMKPPIGAKIATNVLTVEDFGFMVVDPLGVTSAGGAGRGLGGVA